MRRALQQKARLAAWYNSPMIKVIFFGTDAISAPSLSALIDAAPYEVVAVVTKPDFKRGRGQTLTRPEVAQIADQHGIPVLQPEKLSTAVNDIAAFHADCGALVAYGKIIPESVIDLFPHGIINFHPSMLPVYRGPSPIETAVARGDHFTGLTLMQVAKAMDAGPIFYQERVDLTGDETTADLYAKFAQRGAELFVAKLADIVAGKLPPLAQDDDLATYCHMIRKEDGALDPATMTARECYNRLRAFGAWPKCRIEFGGQSVIVTKAKALEPFTGDAWADVIPCRGDSALQLIEILNPKSGKRMKPTDFLRGLHKN